MRLSASRIPVMFAGSLTQDPTATNAFRIEHSGTLRHQVTAFLEGLEQPLTLGGRIPTLQELVEELGNVLGLDVQRWISVSLDREKILLSSLRCRSIPTRLQFTKDLDFGATIPGLAFDASGKVTFTVDPQFRIPLGIRLHPDVPIGQRFFLAEDEQPEITLAISALVDDPSITGKIQDIFQVRLQEDGTAPNQGISLTGTVTVNLVDPTASGDGHDERITLDEFSPAELTDMFLADIEGALDIDGLTLAADVAGATPGLR